MWAESSPILRGRMMRSRKPSLNREPHAGQRNVSSFSWITSSSILTSPTADWLVRPIQAAGDAVGLLAGGDGGAAASELFAELERPDPHGQGRGRYYGLQRRDRARS